MLKIQLIRHVYKYEKSHLSKEYGKQNKHATIKAKQAVYGASTNQAFKAKVEAAEQALVAQIYQQIQDAKSNN